MRCWPKQFIQLPVQESTRTVATPFCWDPVFQVSQFNSTCLRTAVVLYGTLYYKTSGPATAGTPVGCWGQLWLLCRLAVLRSTYTEAPLDQPVFTT